jgi:1-phosphofructokinase family hexose kinase
MILTVTLNPTVDVDFVVNGLRPGERHRADVSERSPGGAGINVSINLSRLGFSSTATGFLAGCNGAYILNVLQREKVSCRFVHMAGETRVNVCVVDANAGNGENAETRLFEKGAEVPEVEKKFFLRCYERLLGRTGKVVMGGSLPPGIDVSFCAALMQSAKNAAIPTILCPREEDMEAVLEERPTVVKLDAPETEKLDALLARAEGLHRVGTEWVVFSVGREKAVFSCRKSAWLAESPAEEMVYMYASGDALMAGLVASLEEGAPPEAAARFAMACAWECAAHPGKFPRGRDRVEVLSPRVRLTKAG